MMSSDRLHIALASFWIPDHLPKSAWQAHAPFAFWLAQAIEPRRFVELGTHSGMSFFTFCQAFKKLGLKTSATAIDTWEGDTHAGFYDEAVYDQVAVRVQQYAIFADLIRSTFDAAVAHFDDASIDLLHIDGCHDYDSVRHDFDTWRPKLTHNAVVLFHDTQVRTPGFGVWKLFSELSIEFPSFEFVHGHGLGVLCPNGEIPEKLQRLLAADAAEKEATRDAYAALGAAIEERWRSISLRNGIDTLLEPNFAPSQDALARLALEADGPKLSRLGARLPAAKLGRMKGQRQRLTQDPSPVVDAAPGIVSAQVPAAADRLHSGADDPTNSETTIDLLRRSLEARQEQIKRYKQLRHGNDVQSDLLRAAYSGLAEQIEHDRQASTARHAELVRWGQGRKARLDALMSQLDAEVQARALAELRNQRTGGVRLKRLLRKVFGRPLPKIPVTVPNDIEQARTELDIRNTGMLDEAFYRDSNPDLGDTDLVAHFARTGWWEGRRPNPTFDPLFYLATNADVRTRDLNPLVHYADLGIVEGRLPSRMPVVKRWYSPPDAPLSAEEETAIVAVLDTGMFDEEFYRSEYPDVGQAGIDPVVHYALEGWKEGRRPAAHFDPAFYRRTYDDVEDSGLDPLVHYATAGIVEGRLPCEEAALEAESFGAAGDGQGHVVLDILETGLFDKEFYLASNPDIAATGQDPALHFATHGWREGRWPNPYFDPKYYLEHNPDVSTSGTNPLLHFAESGILEGRLPSALPAHRKHRAADDYSRWVAAHDTLTDADRRAMKARLARLSYQPLISVILPVYNPPIPFLMKAIASVQSQTYENWELCIADDASPNPAVRRVLRELAQSDSRIKLVERRENGHISAASNSAIEIAEGEFIALLDHDDVLPDHALFEVINCLNLDRDLDLIYSDEDHLDSNEDRVDPYFKSDYNPELMLGQNLINHFGVYRTSVVRAVGGFRLGYEGSQDYDLALRVIDATTPAKIRHIPAILYHWRSTGGGATFSQTFQEQCIISARKALADHLERRGWAGAVEAHPLVPTWHRVRRSVPHPAPLVSIIVPTKNKAEILAPCCEGILNRTDYTNFELIIVDHQSTEPETLSLLADLSEDQRVRILPYTGPVNYSAINNAAGREAEGNVLAFLNNDVDVIAPDWLSEMVSLACLPDVGAVGAKLLYPDRRVQHAGVVLGVGGVAGHFFHLQEAEEPGDAGRAILTTAVSAVTGACLVVKRSLFELVGGFDATHLAVAFNDVDLCVKIGAAGFRNVMTPYALLYHHESLSRGTDLAPEKQVRFNAEVDFMIEKWGEVLTSDPYYNPNLDLASANFSLAWPPRRRRPWVTKPAV